MQTKLRETDIGCVILKLNLHFHICYVQYYVPYLGKKRYAFTCVPCMYCYLVRCGILGNFLMQKALKVYYLTDGQKKGTIILFIEQGERNTQEYAKNHLVTINPSSLLSISTQPDKSSFLYFYSFLFFLCLFAFVSFLCFLYRIRWKNRSVTLFFSFLVANRMPLVQLSYYWNYIVISASFKL